MLLSLLLALQAAAPAPAAIPLDGSVEFDLARYRPGEARCGEERPGEEILVCGRRQAGPIDPDGTLARRYETGPFMAETRLSRSVTGRAFVESATLPGGRITNRAMVGIKMAF